MKKTLMVLLAAGVLVFAQAAAAAPGTGVKSGRFSVCLNGGMSFIDGGDLNLMIRQTNLAAANISDPNMTAGINWSEFKAAPGFGAEIFYNVSDRFALSLGFEILKKRNAGNLALNGGFSTSYGDETYLLEQSLQTEETLRPENSVSAVPLTLSAYYFVPVGGRGRAFIKAGVGYYMAKLRSTYAFVIHTTQNAYEYYLGELNDSYSEVDNYTRAYSDESKSHALGFHAGLGFEFNISRAFAFVIEGGIRVADLKNWTGTGNHSLDGTIVYGWQSTGVREIEVSDSQNYAGELIVAPDIVFENDSLVLVESNDWGLENTRPAVVKLGGASIKLGLKIRF